MDNHMIKLVKINDANRQEYERLERLYGADLSQYQSRIYPNEEKLLEWYYIVLDGRNIGSVWLEADENPHCAWLGIFIGENGCRGRGIGREVIGNCSRGKGIGAYKTISSCSGRKSACHKVL